MDKLQPLQQLPRPARGQPFGLRWPGRGFHRRNEPQPAIPLSLAGSCLEFGKALPAGLNPAERGEAAIHWDHRAGHKTGAFV